MRVIAEQKPRSEGWANSPPRNNKEQVKAEEPQVRGMIKDLCQHRFVDTSQPRLAGPRSPRHSPECDPMGREGGLGGRWGRASEARRAPQKTRVTAGHSLSEPQPPTRAIGGDPSPPTPRSGYPPGEPGRWKMGEKPPGGGSPQHPPEIQPHERLDLPVSKIKSMAARGRPTAREARTQVPARVRAMAAGGGLTCALCAPFTYSR